MGRRRPRGAWLLAPALTLALAACAGVGDGASAGATSTAAPITPQAPTTSSTTTTTEPTTTTRPTTTTTAAPTTTSPRPDTPELLRRGDRGPAVDAVQRRLRELGYWVGPVDEVFGSLTEQAVFAIQKAAGLERDGVVGPRTRQALEEGRRPQARSRAGRVLEVDERRQLLLVVADGRVRWTFNTCTGTDEHYTYGGRRYLADTPHGRWEIYRQIDGWRESHLGRLYRPKYFHRDGIALHGYTNVPPHAASHGCVRVTLAAIDWMWAEDVAPIGTLVWVY
ncbi:MAG TPA: L,D-transpeptidase family protein [Actinomycetota bacterium]|nr:L,D-transpeptidase family protein [Actinomycetota bacterium]